MILKRHSIKIHGLHHYMEILDIKDDAFDRGEKVRRLNNIT